MNPGAPTIRLPPRMGTSVPARATPETIALPGEPAARFGTFERRTFPLLSLRDKGYWWRVQLVEPGVATPAQVAKGYSRIPCDPEA